MAKGTRASRGSRHAARKGAFDLSLGFIIIVIFAIVLLTLGITWLRGTIEGITGLTDDLTQQASSELQNTFQQTTQNFAIYPSQWELSSGKTLKMSVGIKNNADDGENHDFVVNVIATAASTNILGTCSSFASCPAPQSAGSSYSSLKSWMESWVTWNKAPTTVMVNQIGYNYITVTIPAGAPQGTYMYGFVACQIDGTGISSAEQCTSQTLNWGGSMQPLQILVKPS